MAGLLALMRKEVLARPERPAKFDLHLESDALLLGAETELHSIFQNLVTNAVKYTPPDGTRRRSAGGPTAAAVTSRSRDTGIGIPAAHLPRLTERFYRVDAGRSRKLGGSGLGLAIVKHALQRHGAQLEITSEEGKGSTFTCHFPPARVQLRAKSGCRSRASPLKSCRCQVLRGTGRSGDHRWARYSFWRPPLRWPWHAGNVPGGVHAATRQQGRRAGAPGRRCRPWPSG